MFIPIHSRQNSRETVECAYHVPVPAAQQTVVNGCQERTMRARGYPTEILLARSLSLSLSLSLSYSHSLPFALLSFDPGIGSPTVPNDFSVVLGKAY